ncbi:aminomethyl-transferring glycine dehydrogenase [Porticoccus sp. W117]|uniref:aminomethyl-transferring glycine dehydrogenase n=1 Tax=Porticoccus sp. W117 TaxID=3054777 RepID=UPI002599FA81|nr:aminomethyl-transferring glycine dehydrogenase [Porticoccus sp. W117]MDM3870365.1 aminomethyl-transferring glycine dehydrogenase [Porticoccus sp. W117]
MQQDHFGRRHIGPDATQTEAMLNTLGVSSLDELIAQTVPANIRNSDDLNLDTGLTEQEALAEIKAIASKNQVFTSLIGTGYYDTIVPPVVLRNVLENPGWYTAYTPYQPEISQGRLEALLNYQQMVMDLTGMEIANASLLDEGTAAAEAMAMSKRHLRKNKSTTFFIDADCHPQTIAVVQTRAEHFGWDIVLGNPETDLADLEFFGALLQYPTSTGKVIDIAPIIKQVHDKGALATVAGDLMSMVLMKPAGEMGADIVVGSNQRFGVPMGFGGPHAGFFAFRDEFKRASPGRIIGVSIDSHGKPALRMAMQTREQHIRREKANSNVCTAQALLAIMSQFYAAYHGPEGLKAIASQIHTLTSTLAAGLQNQGFALRHDTWFDTITVEVGDKQSTIMERALGQRINLRKVGDDAIGISLDETSTEGLVTDLLIVFGSEQPVLSDNAVSGIPTELVRSSDFLTHEVFNSYHSETEMMRYMHRLEAKDIALNLSMIPLGSCTMKLNAAAEMIPVTWPEFGDMHPFAPIEQAAGYTELFESLQQQLEACTGYDAVSLQPNAGSQGEYAGLVAIKKYHDSRGDHQRNICLIPSSAHGTNPASAHMVGYKVVVVKCDDNGNVDMADLQDKCDKHSEQLAAIMITYPSTHGVFEENVTDICALVHKHGGQVYVDGANMNALVGLAGPGKFGGDVSHLNLHKTFCIPHGGGGPGMGPIGVGAHLKPFLPAHPVQNVPGTDIANGTISAAPWGSASILPISWMYIRMMGREGMKKATEIAILNANYLARKLSDHYPVLYTGKNGFIAHECIIDIRPLKDASDISEEDIAKRLMDFGFHAPTMSFPVAGTLMIEPTESESKAELDRFIEAMVTIRNEMTKVQNGDWPLDNNPLVNAPHTMDDVLNAEWDRPYSRETAVRPTNWLKSHKYWPTVNRIDNVYGDRNLICSCPTMDSYVDE